MAMSPSVAKPLALKKLEQQRSQNCSIIAGEQFLSHMGKHLHVYAY
jgi:hypothetical protein